MNLQPTQDQRDLTATAKELADRQYHSERSTQQRFAQDWNALAELGVFSLCAPEPEGLALPHVDASLVFEQLGRALVAPAVVTTHVVSDHVPGAYDGSCMVGQTFSANGRQMIQDLDRLTHLAVGDPTGLSIYPIGVVQDAETLDSVDPLTSLTAITVPEQATPTVRIAGPVARRLTSVNLLLHASYQVGIAQGVLDRSVKFSQEREQFGRPIGSFQALKHLMADMLVRLEIARSAVLGAALAIDEDDLQAEQLSLSAKVLADRAAKVNAQTAIQIHGGMGFAWEVDIHLFLKRAWSGATIPFSTAQLVTRLEQLHADRQPDSHRSQRTKEEPSCH